MGQAAAPAAAGGGWPGNLVKPLSQAAPAHTCGCLEKKNLGYPIAQAGAGAPADSQVSVLTHG